MQYYQYYQVFSVLVCVGLEASKVLLVQTVEKANNSSVRGADYYSKNMYLNGGTVNIPHTNQANSKECNCNGVADVYEDGGDCTDSPDGKWCYVDPKNCEDAEEYGGLFTSYSACKKTPCVCNGYKDRHGRGGSCGKFCFVDPNADCPDKKNFLGMKISEYICKKKGYLYLSDTQILKLPSFQEVPCNQHWPEYSIINAFGGLVNHNNTKELMLCGGISITGCRIWTKDGWLQSDTKFNRQRSASSVINDRLLVTGGWEAIGIPSTKDRRTYHKLKSTKILKTTWQDFTELPASINSHCQVTVSNTVYIVGGVTRESWNNYIPTNATFKLTNSNKWSKQSSLNTPRHSHACVEWNGGILAIGGYSHGSGITSVERYNVVSNKWFSFTPIPAKLAHHQAVVWEGDVYVLGGYEYANRVKNKVVYKLKKGSKTWEVVPGVSVENYPRSIFPAVITSHIHCN